MTSAPTSFICEAPYNLSALSHPCPTIRKRAEYCHIRTGRKGTFKNSSAWPRGCGNVMVPAWKGAGAGEGGDWGFGRGFRPGLLGEKVLPLQRRSRKKGEGRDHPSSRSPPSPILDTYLVSVPEGNLDGAPRHDEIRRRAGVSPFRSAAGTPGFWLVQRLAASRAQVVTAAPRRRRSLGFSFPSAA